MSYCPELAKERFMDRLRNQRVDELIAPENKKYLAKLRYNIDAVSSTLKALGRTLRQRGIDLHQIILEASGDWEIAQISDRSYGNAVPPGGAVPR